MRRTKAEINSTKVRTINTDRDKYNIFHSHKVKITPKSNTSANKTSFKSQ